MSGRGDKYLPLARYLATQPGDRAALSFAEIEALIGSALPPGAYGRGFWVNLSHGKSQSRAWQAAGWRVASANIPRRTVTFARREGRP